ncbi:MAG: hypothetical protein JO236_21805 [Mycobacterium sp.]|uniref:MmpS family transport accessory protein n=1 Tax=Mycobacterium sp. TaxID=1785 RepID=UPI001EB4922C|nr:MmpS family transport accessory protein [Mycobacterium sp.]MBW0020156.1 hypothetical protein [Mycobacterium sp.]
MNDPRRAGRFGPPQPGSGRYPPPGPDYPAYVDPAYADQTHYSPTYGGVAPQWAPTPNETNPTKRLPRSWQQDAWQQDAWQRDSWQHDEPPPGAPPSDGLTPAPPQGPRSPRWLWVAAVAAVVLVVALVVALVIANGSAKDQTAIEPLPPMPTPSSTTPTPTTTRTSSQPSAAPAPPTSGAPTTATTGPAGTETVVYNVAGDGRAISIMYMDTGDIIQTEFNVSLPWSKQVSLSKSAVHPATVTVVNIGHNVTCSVTVAGVQVSQRTGVGLTICQGTT